MAKKLTSRPSWAFIIADGDSPALTSWGCGSYFQLPVFDSRKDAMTWAREHNWPGPRKLIRVNITQA